jgi:hypothetical protein
LAEVVPVEQRLEPWVVDRPDGRTVVTALLEQARATVGITTAVHGAGGFAKTTVAKLVRMLVWWWRARMALFAAQARGEQVPVWIRRRRWDGPAAEPGRVAAAA